MANTIQDALTMMDMNLDMAYQKELEYLSFEKDREDDDAVIIGSLNQLRQAFNSRGEMAYTLVDVDSPVPEATIAQIAAIAGVLSVRYLPARNSLTESR